jgi:hypothetical protein
MGLVAFSAAKLLQSGVVTGKFSDVSAVGIQRAFGPVGNQFQRRSFIP